MWQNSSTYYHPRERLSDGINNYNYHVNTKQMSPKKVLKQSQKWQIAQQVRKSEALHQSSFIYAAQWQF